MSDELIVRIDKAFWPKGVVRGLNPELRKLGDKHGNLVLAAQPAKGEIMIRGEPKNIDGVKEELRKLLAEHLPDAPTPEELQEKPAGKPSPKSKPAASPKKEKAASPKSSPKSKPAAAPKKEKTPPPVAKSKPVVAMPTVPANPPAKPVVLRKEPTTAASAPQGLLWLCTRGNSSFIRKQVRSVAPTSGPKNKRPLFSSEPCNLLGLHTLRYSGSVATEALDVRPTKKRASGKETVELVQSHASSSRSRRPDSALVTSGLSKCVKKGLARIDTELDAKFYRRGLCEVAKNKYRKVLLTFKKKKRTVFSRRNSKKDD